MPRPRIDPKLRKRSVRACVPCKLSKVRCDSNQPCSRCSAKGRSSSCVYTESSTKPQQRPRKQSETQTHAPQTQHRAEKADHAPTDSQTPPQANQSRRLLSSKGEKVYVGHTASLSYLGFVRHVAKTSMGPSSFTENEFNNFMLEVEPGSQSAPPSLRSLDQEQRRNLIENFLETSSGILDLFTDDQLEEFLTSSRFPLQNDALFPRKTRTQNAAYKLVLAIGLQCSGSDDVLGPAAASAVFAEGQRFAFEGMLCDVSLDVVGLFLLMSFFMLGACQRNAAFMYLGIASKAASALGLFDGKDEARNLSEEEYSMRQRVWKSLCVLDTIVSAILGRCGSCSSMVAFEDSESHNEPVPRIIDAAYNMCVLIDGLEQDIRKGGNFTSTSAESFLYEVRHCSQRLPPEMRTLTHDTSTAPDHETRKQSVGATHVACAYYFAVILATRPFLTSHLMLKLKDQGLSFLEDKKPSLGTEERLKIANLAQVCLDAAKFMTVMLTQALEAGLLLANMCLMKAWVFGSGLLLGFTLFVEESAATEIEGAFNGAIAVLAHFAARSPQAKHYQEILSHLSDAVHEHSRKRAEDKRKMTSQFLYPMFSTSGANDSEQNPQTYPSPLSTEQLDAEIASNFNMDEVLSAGLDVDLSAAFSGSRDIGEDYWQPFCWGLDGE